MPHTGSPLSWCRSPLDVIPGIVSRYVTDSRAPTCCLFLHSLSATNFLTPSSLCPSRDWTMNQPGVTQPTSPNRTPIGVLCETGFTFSLRMSRSKFPRLFCILLLSFTQLKTIGNLSTELIASYLVPGWKVSGFCFGLHVLWTDKIF